MRQEFKSDSTVTIYSLTDPRIKRVRYVGATGNLKARYAGHCSPSKDSATYEWVMDLRKEGLKPEITEIEVCHHTIWEEREIFWCAHFSNGDMPLLNRSAGGDSNVCPAPDEIRITVRLPQSLAIRLQREAERQCRSLNSQFVYQLGLTPPDDEQKAEQRAQKRT